MSEIHVFFEMLRGGRGGALGYLARKAKLYGDHNSVSTYKRMKARDMMARISIEEHGEGESDGR